MSQIERNILVYADWMNDAQPALMGNLSAIQIRGKEVFAFEYNKDSLKSNYIQLDPTPRTTPAGYQILLYKDKIL